MLLRPEDKEASPLPVRRHQVRLIATETVLAALLNQDVALDLDISYAFLRELFFDRLGKLALNQEIHFTPDTQKQLLKAIKDDVCTLWPEATVEIANLPVPASQLSQHLNDLLTGYERLFKLGSREGWFYLLVSFTLTGAIIVFSDVEKLPPLSTNGTYFKARRHKP